MQPKYEREIDEIVSRAWGEAAPTGRVQSPVLEPLPRVQRPPRFTPPRVGASSLIVAALTLSVLSYPLQWIYTPAVAVVGLLAVALLVASLVLSVARWNRSRPARTWRGRNVDEGRAPFDGLRRRWRRWRAHRRFRDARWN